MEIIGQHRGLDNIFYLKQQETGEYTINYGNLYNSGYDKWFLIYQTEQKEAEEIFEMFYRIWCSTFNGEEMMEQWLEMGLTHIDSDDYIKWE